MDIQCLYQSVGKYLTGASTSVPSPQCSMGFDQMTIPPQGSPTLSVNQNQGGSYIPVSGTSGDQGCTCHWLCPDFLKFPFPIFSKSPYTNALTLMV